MYRGYTISLSKDFNPFREPIFKEGGKFAYCAYDRYEKRGRVGYALNQHIIHDDLSKFIRPDGVIDAKKMMADWFPSTDAQIFISHSHADEELAIAFSQWLKDNFGVTCFIDSLVWGYADKLLRQIDNEFTMKEDGCYDYSLRNRTTAFVHNLLASSLSSMIDKCECLMFLNTPNSIIPDPNQNETSSPWIFHELHQSKIIREKPLRRTKVFSAGGSIVAEARQFKTALPVSTDHLTHLSERNLIDWARVTKIHNPGRDYSMSLDILYALSSK